MRAALLLLIICTACAKQVPLTGGLKDLDAPVLIKTDPPNKTLNFNNRVITLEFDEYIKEENLASQLLITPRIDGTFKSRLSRNRLILEFEQPFDSATTYTLNFREGIKDITEGNVPDNLQFVFSTGSYLDSSSVSGTVRSLMTQELMDDINVSLYHPSDSITIFNGPPLYNTKTNEDGFFSLENIKYGTYLIYAVNDKNQNLKLEPRDESYSFLPSSVLLSDSLSGLEFNLQALDTREIVLQNSRPVGTNFDFKFNKSIVSYTLTSQGPSLYSNLVEDDNTLRIYYHESVKDSVEVTFQVQDSISQKLDSTSYVRFEASTRKPENLSSTFTLKNGPVNKRFNATLGLNKPVIFIALDSIYFRFDSVTQVPIDSSNLSLNYSQDQLDFTFLMDSVFSSDSTLTGWDKKFDFIISEGAIISVEQDTLPEITRTLSIKKREEYGLLAGTINSSYSSFILQLLDNDFEVVEETEFFKGTENPGYQFANIRPGDYSLRVLVDVNANQKWDPGNINTGELPEPVKLFFHPNVSSTVITIRANWEQTAIDISF